MRNAAQRFPLIAPALAVGAVAAIALTTALLAPARPAGRRRTAPGAPTPGIGRQLLNGQPRTA